MKEECFNKTLSFIFLYTLTCLCSAVPVERNSSLLRAAKARTQSECPVNVRTRFPAVQSLIVLSAEPLDECGKNDII